MNVAPKRRWFRFSLRTMFVVVTAVALYLGWNVRLVKQRQHMRDVLAQHNFFGDRFSDYLAGVTHEESEWEMLTMEHLATTVRDPASSDYENFTRHEPTAPYRLPSVRRWLGDAPVMAFAYKPGPSAELVRDLFPEAYVFVRKPESDPTFKHYPLDALFKYIFGPTGAKSGRRP